MNAFRFIDFSASDTQSQVIAVFVDTFKNKNLKARRQLACHLLRQLFWYFEIDFKKFSKKYLPSRNNADLFISYVLYGIYYHEIPVGQLANSCQKETLECYFLALLAESISPNQMQKILISLSLKEQLRLLAYSFNHPREGAWRMMDLLQSIHRRSSSWKTLFRFLKTKFYEATYLNSLLSPEKIHLKQVIQKLEENAFKNVAKILTAIHEIKRATYSFEEMETFLRIFGFTNYDVHRLLPTDLSEILAFAITCQKLPHVQELVPREILDNFLDQFYHQLNIFHHHPEEYADGLKILVYTLPTRGTGIPYQPWLPSLLDGVELMAAYLKKEFTPHPIILFDQAPRGKFKKNALFIKMLAKRYRVKIWHISKNQALKIAKKVGVQSWIQPWGYAGSRNCAFFLAPVLAKASHSGKKSVREVTALESSQLKDFFQEAVLGRKGKDMVIHMSDDDIAIPPSHYFLNASFAYRHQKLYFSRPVYCIGRSTHEVYPFLSLKALVKEPSLAFFSSRWNPLPTSGMMKGMLTKPKFCLPLPFGNEELHVIPPHHICEYFHQPIIHFGGTRFPKKIFPKSPLDGIEDHLSFYLLYSLEICMSSCLLDAKNKFYRSVFPWNDSKRSILHPWKSLGDLWFFARSPKALKELRKRFWKNLKTAYEDPHDLFRNSILDLTTVDASLEAPDSLKKFYEQFQKEAQHLHLFWKALIEKHDIQQALRDVEDEFHVSIRKEPLCFALIRLIQCFSRDLFD